jgi:PilZ domain
LLIGQKTVAEKRRFPRHRVLKGGFIVISEKASKLECTVRNISNSGAAIQVSSTFDLPQTFELILDGVHQKCHVVWRTDTKMGVSFASE